MTWLGSSVMPCCCLLLWVRPHGAGASPRAALSFSPPARRPLEPHDQQCGSYQHLLTAPPANLRKAQSFQSGIGTGAHNGGAQQQLGTGEGIAVLRNSHLNW